LIEIPQIVLKTRALLTLRSYSTDELLEYEDRFVLHPVRGEDDERILSVVWIYKEPRVIGVAVIRELLKAIEEANAHEGALVGGSRITPAAKKLALQSRVELVMAGYAAFDLFGHELVPPHIIAEEDEVDLVLSHFGITRSQLPRIRRTDSAAKVLGAKAGQVIRIERESQTAGSAYYYRLVTDT
jgi:DNA-directed RNA polymerase subunit H (RpoH/RPB5)